MSAIKNFRVDSFVSGLAIKAPVLVATDAAVTLSGEQTVNSRALVVGDRVLVKDQVDTTENGIYVVETSAWQRAGDMDGERDIVGGTVVPVYRVADGLFTYWIIGGNGESLSPGVDPLTFTVFYDPAVSGASLPVSLAEDSILVADAAGGWIEFSGVRGDPGTDSLWIDGNLIVTDGGLANPRIELTASGGTHFTLVTTGGYYLDINPTVRFDSAEFYMLEKAAAGADLVGYGQFWVRDTDGAPMFTDEGGVDYALNSAPSFTPPLVLGDDEQIQFGDSTDVTMEYDSTISGIMVDPTLAVSVPFGFNNGMDVRFYNQLGSQYISLENQGILGFNDLVMSTSGGTSNFSYEVGAWDHNDNRLLRPLLDDYAIQHQTVGSVSNVLDIDFEDGNSAYLALTENVTTMTLSNPPASGRLGQLEIEILQDSVARTIAWPASVLWPGGTAPDLSTTNSRHLIHLRTRDGGTTYLGTYLENFS